MADNNKGRGIIVIIAITVFMFGLVAGMVIVNVTEVKPTKQALNEAIKGKETTISVEGGNEYLKVYVPKREVKYGVIPINSYNLDNFKVDEDGFMAYFDDAGNRISHLGVDISYHQTEINWDELKKTPCEFVMLRCGYRGYTEGGLMEDEKFREYADQALEHGFPIGVYFFTQAISEQEAIDEADFVMSLIEDYPISYPVAIDTENVASEEARTNTAEMSVEERTKYVVAFCERIKANGYYPIIYASENWLRRSLDASMLEPYEIWAPQYLDKNDFMYDFTVWQYTDKGRISGIKGDVDLNISMVDYASFVPSLREAFTNDGEIIEE